VIPRNDGPRRTWDELRAQQLACEAHRDQLHIDYVQALFDGRKPTEEQQQEARRREHETRVVRRMRARAATRIEAHRIVQTEYLRWLNE
jgi:hypothetical protein